MDWKGARKGGDTAEKSLDFSIENHRDPIFNQTQTGPLISYPTFRRIEFSRGGGGQCLSVSCSSRTGSPHPLSLVALFSSLGPGHAIAVCTVQCVCRPIPLLVFSVCFGVATFRKKARGYYKIPSQVRSADTA